VIFREPCGEVRRADPDFPAQYVSFWRQEDLLDNP
jgi:hypothetical protein